jgi:hypothetical protein
MVSMGATETISWMPSGCWGTKADLAWSADFRLCLPVPIPLDQINIILLLVHPLNVLFEVVKTRP